MHIKLLPLYYYYHYITLIPDDWHKKQEIYFIMMPVRESARSMCHFTRLMCQIRKESYSSIKKKAFLFFCFCYSDWNDQRLHLCQIQQSLSEEFTFEKGTDNQSTMLSILQKRNFTKFCLFRFSFWIRLPRAKEFFLLQDEFADFSVFLDLHFL